MPAALRVDDEAPNGTILDDTPFLIEADGNVGIGTAAPANSAILDMVSTTKGLLPPRMTTAQRDAIVFPAAGLQIYNTIDNAYNFFNGSTWKPIGGDSFWAASGRNIINTNPGDVIASTLQTNTLLTTPITSSSSGGSVVINLHPGNDFGLRRMGAGNIITAWASDSYVNINGMVRIGIGTGLRPSEVLQVDGNIMANGNFYPSDQRLKEQITPLRGALEKVAQLPKIRTGYPGNRLKGLPHAIVFLNKIRRRPARCQAQAAGSSLARVIHQRR